MYTQVYKHTHKIVRVKYTEQWNKHCEIYIIVLENISRSVGYTESGFCWTRY